MTAGKSEAATEGAAAAAASLADADALGWGAEAAALAAVAEAAALAALAGVWALTGALTLSHAHNASAINFLPCIQNPPFFEVHYKFIHTQKSRQ